ncbi:MAG TPA: SdrD B-like domain-containing protein [Methylophilaceae bacterium]|mgnify:FL=1|nr:SdrD B-like domain-containing protein [Methylophilaceae bacterium]
MNYHVLCGAVFCAVASTQVTASESCVAGKVFVDCNHNQRQDAKELGIPNVRIFLEDGTYFITDIAGKYSFCGLSAQTHVLKVDKTTLPRGSQLIASSNRNAGDAQSLFLDSKYQQLIRADFIENSCSKAVLEQVLARQNPSIKKVDSANKVQPAITFKGTSLEYEVNNPNAPAEKTKKKAR